MESEKLSKNKNKENQINTPNNILSNIKSNYILSKVYNNMTQKKSLKIVKYNKLIQNRLNISIKNYKEYYEIEIDIIPCKDKYGKFININKNDKIYYHIYFNDNKEEIKDKYEIKEEDKVTKIKIIINYQVKSFEKLFYYCKCIESINFKKFSRNNININNMSYMFYGCSSLKKLNLSNFITNKVTNMSYMFSLCSSLKDINLSNFNTNNVTNMSYMFLGCSSLKKLNLSNFITDNVINMSYMFFGCSSLKKSNLSNFNTNNVTNMSDMFFLCSSLKEINLPNFNIEPDMNTMLYGLSIGNYLKKKECQI